MVDKYKQLMVGLCPPFSIKIFLTIVIASLFFWGCGFKNQMLGQNNAVWAESMYLRGHQPTTGEELTDEYLKNFANTLKKRNIKYAYLFAGPYQKDGHLPNYAFADTAVSSVSKLKEYYPGIVLLPWIGGIQNRNIYLGDSSWVKNALADTKKLVDVLNVSGVHIDFEYVLPGEPFLDDQIDPEKPGDREAYSGNVNSFHKQLRGILPDAFISSVVVATSSDTKPWKKKTELADLGDLIGYVDQISFLFYDTQVNDQAVFKASCLEMLKDINELKKSDAGSTEYLVALGTFINGPELRKYRNMDIEGIPNTLETIKQSLSDLDFGSQVVDGIAIYCDWETDVTEWVDIYDHWTKY